MPPIIEAEHLVKKFDTITAVKDVSFQVGRGEIFGFLGPNGAGKTTTINILCTLIRPTSGQASVCGYDVVKEQNRVRRCIALVFQEPSLDERMTALDNLKFHAYVYNLPQKLARERIEEVLRMVELWERRDSLVRTFSGGMKRRLELARGLLHHPQVLFLDEPTLGLDPQTRVRMWEYIHQLRREKEITVFLTTHYMDEAENADCIAIIDNGIIVALDTPEALKSKVSGDLIYLETEKDEAVVEELATKFGIQALKDGNGLRFEVPQGNAFIPQLVSHLSIPIRSLSLRRPTLEDVFIKLTGKELREEELSGAEALRDWARRYGRRQRHG